MGFAAPVMLAMGVAGAGISAAGAIEQGRAAQANALYQAQVARNNAIIAGQNESWTQASGAAQEAAQGMKTRALVGRTKAAFGANNIDVNSGSANKTVAATEEMGDLDAMTIRSNTARAAYGYAVQGESDTAQSKLLTTEAPQLAEAGDISGLGTFLSGASSVGARWAGYQTGAPQTTQSVATGEPMNILPG